MIHVIEWIGKVLDESIHRGKYDKIYPIMGLALTGGVRMIGAIAKLTRTGLMLLIASSMLAATPLPLDAPVPAAQIAPLLPGIQICPNPMAVIKAFYDANDASQYDASLALLTPDITLASWGEGVNGRHWTERHLTGKEQIRPFLAERGLRRSSGTPESPIFHETEFMVSGKQVTFMLRPDRVGPNGREYDPYAVTIVFRGCKIASLTVVERFTAP
jgi:hypothetical protein